GHYCVRNSSTHLFDHQPLNIANFISGWVINIGAFYPIAFNQRLSRHLSGCVFLIHIVLLMSLNLWLGKLLGAGFVPKQLGRDLTLHLRHRIPKCPVMGCEDNPWRGHQFGALPPWRAVDPDFEDRVPNATMRIHPFPREQIWLAPAHLGA